MDQAVTKAGLHERVRYDGMGNPLSYTVMCTNHSPLSRSRPGEFVGSRQV